MMKTFKNLVFVAIVAIFGIVGFIGCGGDDAPPKVSVTGVTLDKSEITLLEGGTYTLKATVEPKKATNKKVSWESDNETVATVNSTGKVTALATGTATITVTTKDKGKTAECAVTVKPVPTKIEVTKSPTTIKMGEQLDLAEIEVTATYSDDSEDAVEITLANISGFAPTTAGKQTVTVTYAELTDTFDVWVLALSKIEVALIDNLSHILIGQGEEIDLEDITVTATWKNESDEVHVITEPVTITLENLSAFDRTKADTHTVTVTYNGKTDTFEVLVLGVTSIAVTKQPTKTTYKIGEQLDLAGLELTVTFSDNEAETIHGSALSNDVTGFNSTTAGEKTVTITYGGQIDTFTVNVLPNYTVTFNSNGGSAVVPATVAEGDTVTEPIEPTKLGYEFIGWYKEAELTTAWDFDVDTVTNDTALYAKWEYDGSLNLGDTGSGGGKIFYRSETGFTMTDDNSIAHYLEAAPADMPTTLRWSTATISPFPDITGTATAIGTGRKNTALILAMDTDALAAKACNEYTNNGKTDWFLPSKDELNELYVNRTSVGNLETSSYSSYWSSSQTNNDFVWSQNFTSGSLYSDYLKIGTFVVRAVRAF